MPDLSLSKWNHVVGVRFTGFGGDVAVKPLVLEKQYRVVASSGGFEQSFCILGIAAKYDVPTRRVRINCFNALRMEGPTFDTTATGDAHNQRIRPCSVAAPSQS